MKLIINLLYYFSVEDFDTREEIINVCKRYNIIHLD
jgi:hypothetical protein